MLCARTAPGWPVSVTIPPCTATLMASGLRWQRLGQYLVHLASYLSVRNEEDAQQVTAAHQANQLAVGVDHRQSLDVVGGHQAGSTRNGRVWVGGDRG